MKIYHTTSRKNLASILAHGLLISRSTGKLAACWLHSEAKTTWALCHTVQRHGGRIENAIRFTLDVPKELVKRSKPGLYYVLQDIPASCILTITPFGPLASSPVRSASKVCVTRSAARST